MRRLLLVILFFLSGVAAAQVGVGDRSLLLKKFTPVNVAGLALWLDASDAATITQSGGAVSQWNDKSGNGRNVSQAVGAKQPIIATAAQNGRNTLAFTVAATTQMSAAASVNFSSGYTAFAVVRHVDGSSMVVLGAIPSSPVALLGWWTANDIYAYGLGSAIGPDSNAVSTSTYSVVTLNNTTSAGSIFVHVDGANVTISTNQVAVSPAWQTIGAGDGSTYTNGHIAEVLIYDHSIHVPSAAEVTSVERYLKAKWATP